LATLNSESRSAKWGVALDFAVAPRASSVLNREICTYLDAARIERWILEIFLKENVKLLMIQLGKDDPQTTVPKELRLQERIVPCDAFQHLKRRFKKESFIVGGRFAETHVFRCAMSYGLGVKDLSTLFESNEIWLSQAGRMWDNVLHEIVAQQVQIDWEERSDALAAVEVLSRFDRTAGLLYAEASERYTTIPHEVWADIGRKIDQAGTSLKDTLEPAGKNVLRALGQKMFINTWEEALTCDSDFGILESKTVIDGTVKYKGMLNRHAKRAVYRARDKYRKALEHIYEKRVHL
jgi:hypothetical protein